MRQLIWAMALTSLFLVCGRAVFADDAGDAPTVRVKFSAAGDTALAQMANGASLFSDKDVAPQNLPFELLGLTFTRRAYAQHSSVSIDAVAGTTVYLMMGSSTWASQPRNAAKDAGWTKLCDAALSDRERPIAVYKQVLAVRTQVAIPTGGIYGVIVAARNLTVEPPDPVVPKKPAVPPAIVPTPVAAQHADPPPDDFPTTGPSTRPIVLQASVKVLEIGQNSSGKSLRSASEMILTTTPSYFKKLTAVRFAQPVGDQMCLARDDALRYIRLTYPNWNVGKAEITFEDNSAAYDSDSIGTAIGVLIHSCIEGFAIDPNIAVSGSINAKGQVHAVSGGYAKIHMAMASTCTLVAVPVENLDKLVDAALYDGPNMLEEMQVIGITDLADAVAAARTNRDPKLAKAIAIFVQIQKRLKAKPDSLAEKEVQEMLKQTLAMAPRHLSAQVLLSIAQAKQPATLSLAGSQYYTFLCVKSLMEAFQQQSESTAPSSVPSTDTHAAILNLRRLRPLADPRVRPLVDAWSDFVSAWNRMQEGIGSPETVDGRRQAIVREMNRENITTEALQKMLAEGS